MDYFWSQNIWTLSWIFLVFFIVVLSITVAKYLLLKFYTKLPGWLQEWPWLKQAHLNRGFLNRNVRAHVERNEALPDYSYRKQFSDEPPQYDELSDYMEPDEIRKERS